MTVERFHSKLAQDIEHVLETNTFLKLGMSVISFFPVRICVPRSFSSRLWALIPSFAPTNTLDRLIGPDRTLAPHNFVDATSRENLLSQVVRKVSRTFSPRPTAWLSNRVREQIFDGHTEEPSQPQSKFQGWIVTSFLHGNYGLSSHLHRVGKVLLSQPRSHSKSPHAVLQSTGPLVGFA